MNKSGKYLVWTLLSVMGAFALGYIALNRGEQINALWIVVASVCVYLIAYRFYGLYIAKNVLAVDPTRMTPAVRHNDGLDYVPTDKKVLFGHHFAAIAGAGPLVGPVLAAQMGYLPGMIWLLAGVVLAGAVQDFMVLFVSTRRDGRSLGELVKEEMGPTAGVIALVACFMIMVIILAVLAMIVVKALTHSPWGRTPLRSPFRWPFLWASTCVTCVRDVLARCLLLVWCSLSLPSSPVAGWRKAQPGRRILTLPAYS